MMMMMMMMIADDEMKMKQCIAIHNILLILFVRGKATAHGHSCIRKLVSQDGSDCSTVTSFPATLITKSLVADTDCCSQRHHHRRRH